MLGATAVPVSIVLSQNFKLLSAQLNEVGDTLLVGIASCPDCGASSRRIHSRYVRHLGDLPVSGYQAQLHVTVRRFKCRSPSCPRQTFAEPVPELADRHARRTVRL